MKTVVIGALLALPVAVWSAPARSAPAHPAPARSAQAPTSSHAAPAQAQQAQARPAQAPGAAKAGQRMSLDAVVKIAVSRATRVLAARAGSAAASAAVDAIDARRLPRLNVSGNLFVWNGPLDVNFALGAAAPASKFHIRDQVTAQVTAQVTQPLTDLIRLGDEVDATRAGARAATASYQGQRLEAGYDTAAAYLRLLAADAQREVSKKSLDEINAQLARAEILEKNGALEKVDVLRLQSAQAEAENEVLRSSTDVSIARRALVMSLALPPTTAIQAFDNLPDPPPRPPLSEEIAIQRALARQPALRAARDHADQARDQDSAARAARWPTLAATTAYQHTEGQSAFEPANAWFGGVVLSWDVWDWGERAAHERQARAQAAQAALQVRQLSSRLAFDAQRRWLDARTAYAALKVAKTGQQAAEEAYRIQSIKYAQGAASTTDVLSAQTEVFRARTRYSLARYSYFNALAALARAVGELPVAWAKHAESTAVPPSPPSTPPSPPNTPSSSQPPPAPGK